MLPVYIGILLGSDQEKAINCSGKNSLAWLAENPMFYCWYFCYFPPHWFWSGLAWKDHVHQLVPLSDGEPLIIILGLHQMEVFHFHFLEKQKQWILEPTNRRMSCFQLSPLVLALVLVGRPCIGPVLGSVLALAASDGQDALMGAIYLPCLYLGNGSSVFTVGLSI